MVVAISFAASPKPEPDVVKLLPVKDSVKGWEVYPQTLVYAFGKNLTLIYDGGFELYTKNGVLDAAQQMYRTKSPEIIATVTVHRLTSSQSAKLFYERWWKSDKKQKTYKPVKALRDGYTYAANGAVNGYSYRGRFFVTLSIGSEMSRADAEAFMEWVDKAIGKLT
jgi:hypothetical protein